MTLKELSAAEKDAVADLMVMAMFTDGHLATAEDDRIHQLLTQLGYAEKSDRDVAYGAAVTRVRKRWNTIAEMRAHAANVASAFAGTDRKNLALQSIESVIKSDDKVGQQESEYLAAVRQALR